MVFPVVTHGCESWTIKTAEHQGTDALNCGAGEDSWESLNAWKWKVKVKSLSRVQLLATMSYSPPDSSIRGIFQARVLEWGAIAFSVMEYYSALKKECIWVSSNEVDEPRTYYTYSSYSEVSFPVL